MKKRHGVLALLCVVSALTFLDRLAVPLAEPGIRGELHLSPDQWGWVLSAYVLANALFEIPSGALGDRTGQRVELTRISLWWSAFTAATGWCRSFLQIAGARFLFGMGAAGAYPNAAAGVERWFPKREHARAQGFVWAASRLGGALAPLLLVPLMQHTGWRATFWLLGIAGIVWAAVWFAWVRTRPEEMPGITVTELVEIGSDQLEGETYSTPWATLLRLPHLWLITAAYFCYAWASWFYFGWFTTWLVRGVGFSLAQMSLFTSLTFAMGLAGNLLGGIVSERLVSRHGRKRVYRSVTGTCLLVTSLLLVGMSLVRGHAAIATLAMLGFGIMDCMLPAAWAMCMSLGGRSGGTATGVMNTAGNLGGWVCTILFGYVVQATGDYNLPLRGVAVMVLVGAILFASVDCTRGLGDDLRLSREGT